MFCKIVLFLRLSKIVGDNKKSDQFLGRCPKKDLLVTKLLFCREPRIYHSRQEIYNSRQEILIILLNSKWNITFSKTHVIDKIAKRLLVSRFDINHVFCSNLYFNFVFIKIFTFCLRISHKYVINIYLPRVCVIFVLSACFMCAKCENKSLNSLIWFFCVAWNGNVHFDKLAVYLYFYIPDDEGP